MRLVRSTISKIVFGIIVGAIVVFVIFVWSKNSGVMSFKSDTAGLEAKLLQKGYVGSGPFVAEELVPPTNKWFSALAFKQPPAPVYPQPLAVQYTNSGIDIGRPEITAGKNVVTAPFTTELTVTATDRVLKQQIIEYDDLSVKTQQSSGDDKVLSSRLTRGSPFVFFELEADEALNISSSHGFISSGRGNYLSSDKRFGVYIADTNQGLLSEDNKRLTISPKNEPQNITIFTLPDGVDAAVYFDAARNPISKATVKNKISAAALSTSLDITTDNNKPTIYGLLPFMYANNKQSLGSHQTLEGKQQFYKGNSFTYESDTVSPQTKLDVSSLSGEEKAELSKLVTHESQELSFEKNDSYFASKELYRAAQLLQLARQLSLDNEAAAIQSKLSDELGRWFDTEGYKKRENKYFYYDTAIKGLVAVEPSFGSEEFSDHHFHYGYFIAAAAIISEYDDSFFDRHKGFIELLVSDIANTNRSNKAFPYLRTFDSYIGHSWASGFGIFNDGQNQESSSEAVAAWSAVYHWAKVSNNDELKDVAQALFTHEADAANRQWVHIDRSSDLYENYASPYVSLVWSGKLEHSTFFSDKAEAKLGIQMLPMQPSAEQYIKVNADRSAQNLENMDLTNSQFSDYLIMYQALTDRENAKKNLAEFNFEHLDGALSKSYLYAWVFSTEN